jgi:hypothetical protein
VRLALRATVLALSFAIGTSIVGWWTVPLFAAVAAVVARDVPHQAATAALAGGVAWGALLVWSAIQGCVWSFARIAGGAMGVSGVLLILMTLAFPAALARSAASVAQLLTRAKPVTN